MTVEHVSLYFVTTQSDGGSPERALPPTLEETLRWARARFALLSDMLELQAMGAEHADHPLDPDASRALAETGWVEAGDGDLERVLSRVPYTASSCAATLGGRAPDGCILDGNQELAPLPLSPRFRADRDRHTRSLRFRDRKARVEAPLRFVPKTSVTRERADKEMT